MTQLVAHPTARICLQQRKHPSSVLLALFEENPSAPRTSNVVSLSIYWRYRVIMWRFRIIQQNASTFWSYMINHSDIGVHPTNTDIKVTYTYNDNTDDDNIISLIKITMKMSMIMITITRVKTRVITTTITTMTVISKILIFTYNSNFTKTLKCHLLLMHEQVEHSAFCDLTHIQVPSGINT